MVPGANGTQDNGVAAGQLSHERTSDMDKTPRHPRWTRQETLVLIEGKSIAEERGRRGRRSSYVFGSNQVEPKWDYVSTYCGRHGVNRGPVQCRKRWSNLLSDFKKIKTWESLLGREGQGFWMMRSDERRERKLPGFFDRDVFDVLDGKLYATDSYRLALVTTSEDPKNGDGVDDVEVEDEDEMAEDEEGEGMRHHHGKVEAKQYGIPSPVPISEIRIPPFHQTDSDQEYRRQPKPHFWRASEFQKGAKRRRCSSSDYQNIDMNEQLIKALERNNNMLNAHLEHQKLSSQMNREQQKEQHDSLIASLNKFANILEKIANKL